MDSRDYMVIQKVNVFYAVFTEDKWDDFIYDLAKNMDCKNTMIRGSI